MYSFVKENSDFVYCDTPGTVCIGIILNDPFYLATVRCDFTCDLRTRLHLKPASSSRRIFFSVILIHGASLIWIFLYDALKSLHHCPSDRYSPDFDRGTLQWPSFFLYFISSANHSSNVLDVDTLHLKPASSSCCIISCVSFRAVSSFWIFLYDTLKSLHHYCKRLVFSRFRCRFPYITMSFILLEFHQFCQPLIKRRR